MLKVRSLILIKNSQALDSDISEVEVADSYIVLTRRKLDILPDLEFCTLVGGRVSISKSLVMSIHEKVNAPKSSENGSQAQADSEEVDTNAR